MKFLRSTVGYMIAGMIVMSVWGAFAGAYGIGGGYFAAFMIIWPNVVYEPLSRTDQAGCRCSLCGHGIGHRNLRRV